MAREFRALLSQLEEWQMARPEANLLEDLEEAKEVDWRSKFLRLAAAMRGLKKNFFLSAKHGQRAQLWMPWNKGHFNILPHENSVACSIVTEGDPLFKIGAMYVFPSPVHNNLGIVGKSSQELEALYSALDDEGQTQTETTQRREARKEVERLHLVLEGKEGAAKAHHDVAQQSMAELTALRESVGDVCNDVASEAIAARDRIGDSVLATAEGYGWPPTRGEGRKQR